jgi:predicted alpha/beta-fold hydrolase
VHGGAEAAARAAAALHLDHVDGLARALLERWRTAGRNVRHAVLPVYVEMMSDPHESQVPAAFIAEITGWLDAVFPSLRSSREPRPTSSVVVRGGGRSISSALIADRIEERVHLLDEHQRLFGVMTLPLGTLPDRAVVLMTSGANHHIGQSRLHVKLARRLAAAGWMVLRYDVSGIGDSPPRDGAPENEVYTAHAVPDLAVALNFLQREFAPKRTEVMGLCSGGYHAFKGAVDGLPLSGVTVINPLVFFWKPGLTCITKAMCAKICNLESSC